MAKMKTSLEPVPTPSNVLPGHEDELFVRLSFYSPDSETLDDPSLAFTMPVSDLLKLLYQIADDVKQIVETDIGRNSFELPPPGIFKLN